MAEKKTIISGDHPLLEEIKGGTREICNDAGDMFIAFRVQDGSDPLKTDMDSIGVMKEMCRREGDVQEGRMKVHILLHSPEAMKMMQTWDQDEDISRIVEIFPFTLESYWASRLLVSYPTDSVTCSPLDREPVTLESDKTVHLLIIGNSTMAVEFARHAALVCHFPNYTRDHSLRTRITFVDPEAENIKTDFISAHQALMDNSFYRSINLSGEEGKSVTELHTPEHHGRREEFVDVEWEFVTGDAGNVILREKLKAWASSENKLLTVAVCGKDDNENIRTAMRLPDEIYDRQIPVLVRVHDDAVFNCMRSRKHSSMKPFGMDRCSYDMNLPVVRIAKMINHAYDVMYPVEIDMDAAEESWNRLSNAKKWSNIYHAMTLSTKMRSLGHPDDDWTTFYSISANETETLAEVEHNRWSVEELILGFRPVTDKEQKEIENDISLKREYRDRFIHYDLRAYNDLKPDANGTDVRIYDKCITAAIPLIAATFRKEVGHE